MYLIFDTETTGLPRDWKAPVTDSSNWPRIVQLAWAKYDGADRLVSAKNYIIKPQGFIIPEGAVRKHKITTERANKEGVALKAVLDEFSKALDESDFLIAHNMSFDASVVGAEFLREGIQNSLFEAQRICTQMSSTDFCKLPGRYGKKYKWPSLQELYSKLFEKGFEGAHNASVDVDVCAECFFELKRRGVIKIG